MLHVIYYVVSKYLACSPCIHQQHFILQQEVHITKSITTATLITYEGGGPRPAQEFGFKGIISKRIPRIIYAILQIPGSPHHPLLYFSSSSKIEYLDTYTLALILSSHCRELPIFYITTASSLLRRTLTYAP